MIFDAFMRRQLVHVCSIDRDLYFPYGRIDFVRSAMKWRREAKRDDRYPISDIRYPFTVILQSYKRPWNVELMVKMLLRFDCVSRVIVSNNNPDFVIRYPISDIRVEVINQSKRYTASKFMMIAKQEAEKGVQYFLSVDDDLLLFPQQIETLMRALVVNSSVPHGLVGQRVRENVEWMHHLTGDVPVDIINRVYAFTADHIKRYIDLLHHLGYESEEAMATLPFGSDLVLSRSGTGKPRIHDVGKLLSCPTNAKPGIARFKDGGFMEYRSELWKKLKSVSP